MRKARFAKIADFCQTGSGTTPSRQKLERYYGGPIPWVKSGELRETEITRTEECITETAIRETSLKVVPSGALLVAMYGATVGRVGRLGVDATTNQAVCHIIPDRSVADPQYMFHALCAKASELVAKGVGGAQPNISQGTIKDTEIYLPPLEEQKRIAAILDQADELRRKRQSALDRLNQLGQAIFIEMFGDPRSKQTEGGAGTTWQTAQLREICSPKQHKTIPVSMLLDEGFPVYGANGQIGFYSEYTHVDETVAITCRGATCGTINVAPAKSYITGNAMALDDLDIRRIDLRFLVYALKNRGLHDVISGSAQPQITRAPLLSVEIPLPPLDRQKRFAKVMASVDLERASIEIAKARGDALFVSLQHRAFRGELTASSLKEAAA
jgi:type I restriction enzyme S subunit